MKKLIASIALFAFSLSFLPTAFASGNSTYCDLPFVDINGHWAFYSIEDLYCRGIVEGRSYYYYEPNETVTRAEFLKVTLLNSGVDVFEYSSEDEPYDDVSKNDWFWIYVVAGYELGLIHYNEDFRPEDPVNRAEATAMLVRHSEVVASESYTNYWDVPIDAWYSRYIRAATNWGVVQGYPDRSFRPSNNVTRAEAAEMVSNAYDAWYKY